MKREVHESRICQRRTHHMIFIEGKHIRSARNLYEVDKPPSYLKSPSTFHIKNFVFCHVENELTWSSIKVTFSSRISCLLSMFLGWSDRRVDVSLPDLKRPLPLPLSLSLASSSVRLLCLCKDPGFLKKVQSKRMNKSNKKRMNKSN